MNAAILDDHLLRDVLTDEISASLRRLLVRHDLATTNLYYLRLCRSAASSHGGRLTGGWPAGRRRDLARMLTALPDTVGILPMRTLAFSMAEVISAHRVSSLGAEAVVAAGHLDAPLCVWEGDDGPRIRAAAKASGVDYRTLTR